MSTVLQFRQVTPQRPRAVGSAMVQPCEIVIFPGVRIERHAVDLAHRLVESAGYDFEQFDGRPRHTS